MTETNDSVSAQMSLGDTDLPASNAVVTIDRDLHVSAAMSEERVTLTTVWDLT
jgi:hypothetical protein